MIKQVLRRTWVHDMLRRARYRREYRAWQRGDRTGPSPHILKQQVLREYGREFRPAILIETGTYFGDMLWAMRGEFGELHSIELSPELHARAVRRFRRQPQVHIHRGDSGTVLPDVLGRVSEPALFWLDGHYSGEFTASAADESPVRNELLAIFRHRVRDHVVLIDDARCFTGLGGYPTLDELRAMVAAARPGWTCDVADDVIRIHPPRLARRDGA